MKTQGREQLQKWRNPGVSAILHVLRRGAAHAPVRPKVALHHARRSFAPVRPARPKSNLLRPGGRAEKATRRYPPLPPFAGKPQSRNYRLMAMTRAARKELSFS